MALGRRTPSHCFYHDEKDDLRAAISGLKAVCGIPRGLLSYIPMTVCSCRKKTQNRTDIVELKLLDERESLSDSQLLKELSLQNTTGPTTSALETFVSRAIKEKGNYGNESAVRFVLLLKMALRSSFQLILEEKKGRQLNSLDGQECISSSSSSKDIKTSSGSKRNAPAGSKGGKTPQAIRYIIQKRKRESDGMVPCVLPMFGGLLKVLQNDKEIGEHFRAISLKYKPCVIEVNYNVTGENMQRNRQEAVLKIWCKRMYLRTIEITLKNKALELQNSSKRENDIQRRKRYNDMAYCKQFYDRRNTRTDHYLQIKDRRQEQYNRKKTTAKRKNSPPQAKGISVKCYNCLEERKTLSHKHDAPDVTTSPSLACRFHPGFIVVKRQWSCCGRDVDSGPTTKEQHSDHGCLQGPHKWHYQTKKSGNNKSGSPRYLTPYKDTVLR